MVEDTIYRDKNVNNENMFIHMHTSKISEMYPRNAFSHTQPHIPGLVYQLILLIIFDRW